MRDITNIITIILFSYVISIIVGIIIIKLLSKNRINQRISIYLDRHKDKDNTPTMGGLIFSITLIICIVILYLLKKITLKYNLLIILFTFFSYSLVGFIDDYLIVKKNNNKGLSEISKLIMQIIIAIIFFYLFLSASNEPFIWIRTLNIKLNVTWYYGIFILFILVASSNAVNLTDGLDGLAGGLSLIAFITFGIVIRIQRNCLYLLHNKWFIIWLFNV